MPTITLGLDLGDRTSTYCQLAADGTVTARGKVATTPAALQPFFAALPPGRVILEVGSPRVEQLRAQ